MAAKKKNLSNASEEILIKCIILVIPTYIMQRLLLPRGFIHDIEVMILRFFYRGNEGASKIHWKAGEVCCNANKDGGSGFRDLESFNHALITKQIGRLITRPNSLVSQILQAKYFPHADISRADLGSRPSYIWRSFLEGRDLMFAGL